MIVRELIAKLKFDIDTSGAEKFQAAMKGVRTGLNALLVGKGLNAASQLEDTFLAAQRKIEYLAGPAGLGALNDALLNVSATASEVDIATAMRRGLEITSDPQFTKKMVEFGGLLTDAFGGEFQANIENLMQGAFSGDFSNLVGAGLFTQQEAEFLKGANINTVMGKMTVINKLEEKRNKLLEARNKSLKTQGTQENRLARNLENFGQKIGSFLNPIIGGILNIVNDFFEFFIGSPMAMAIAKVAAFAGAMTVVAGAIMAAGTAIKLLMLFLSPALLTIAAISAAIVATGLLIEDAFFAGKDFKDSYLGQGLLWLWDMFKMISPVMTLIGDMIDVIFGKDIKDTPTYKGIRSLVEMISGIGDKISSFANALNPGQALNELNPFAKGGAGEGVASGVGGFLNSLNPFQETPSPAIAGGGASSVVDNRKVEISIQTQNGNPEEIKKAVNDGLSQSGFMSQLINAKNTLQARDTKRTGSNGL